MIHQQLTYTPRSLIGSEVRKLRKEALLPAVIYGNKLKNQSITIDYKVFARLYKLVGSTTVVDLVLDGSKDKISCLIYDLDIDPVKGHYRHADFLAVDLKKKIESEVPLEFVGEVSKEAEGVLVKNISEIEIEALPENIPHFIEVDLSSLKAIGDVIKVSDLPQTDKYEIISEGDVIVASLVGQEEEVEETTSTEVTEIPTTQTKTETSSVK
jgi:large subunit ribosomal protein L25